MPAPSAVKVTGSGPPSVKAALVTLIVRVSSSTPSLRQAILSSPARIGSMALPRFFPI